ncbi:MAG TPA: urea ABC transporter permease subunit UrtB [Geminicoccus sp.]|jgi:urea transport system permease protein|uniref:urea ABC transporter permease subunit UrtB n=1 Tax=Geminicoccus sp. TaxID=2024832 RepID=UPI002E324CC7|nr:urea ABC transporter permease subunit UrtB [Geminicoccus sp.]HEX2526495.1 urea ABC transporter permease subunit UrtB [Geminicoccus sp.]
MRIFLRVWLAMLVLSALGTGSVSAASLSEASAGLSPRDFAATGAAIEAIASGGDPAGLGILQALSDGTLEKLPDGRLVIATSAGATDALTGAAVTPMPTDGSKIRLNNRLRTQLRAAIGRFGLTSPDPAQRLAAVDALLSDRSPEAFTRLEEALAREQDPAVAGTMRFGVAILALSGTDKAKKLAAVETLSGVLDPRAQGILSELASSEADPDLKAAANDALSAIAQKRFWIDIAVNLYQGISLGSILLLAAVGLAVTFGVAGVINMAHGEMLMLGAYATFVVQQIFRTYLPPSMIDWYLIAAIPAAALVAGFFGLLIERGVIRFLYGRPLETLLATWGISLILQQVVRSVFGPTNREVANPSWMTGAVEFAGVTLTYNRLIIIVFSLLVLAIVWFVLQRSRFGLEMRAVTQNRRMAAAVGIDTARVDALTFALGSAVAGMGGVALSQVGNVSPNLGTLYIVDSFMVVVFGGVGQLAGTVVGALTLGMLNKLMEPFAGAVLAKVLLLVIVILFIQKRPKGLFVLKGRSAEV